LVSFFLNSDRVTVNKPKVDFRGVARYLAGERKAQGPDFLVLTPTPSTELSYYDRDLPDRDAEDQLRWRFALAAKFVFAGLGRQHRLVRDWEGRAASDALFVRQPGSRPPFIQAPHELSDDDLQKPRTLYLVLNRFWPGNGYGQLERLKGLGFSSEKKLFDGIEVYKLKPEPQRARY
ncbi:MAG TPA: hypothetical protein VL404_04350, partial [Candidatus Eisenbacteria bacterium]|nr:hypothetical protein [Candidatus Eisenbacteria bacterium]